MNSSRWRRSSDCHDLQVGRFPVITWAMGLLAALVGQYSSLAESCPRPDFMAPKLFPAGSNSLRMAAGRFNDDAHLDLAVADWGSNRVVLLTGTGDGFFTSAGSFAVGAAPAFVTAADIDGDGRSALVTANWGVYDPSTVTFTNAGISVLKRGGDGTFQTADHYFASNRVEALAIGDLNGDGLQDVVAALWSLDRVSVLMGLGGDGLQPVADFPAGLQPTKLVLADLNVDGIVDVAVAAGYQLALLPGDGAGGFSPPDVRVLTNEVTALAAADFNGDGGMDLALGVLEPPYLSVQLNRGDGTFRMATGIGPGSRVSVLAVDDSGGDGKQGLWLAGPDGVLRLKGRGDGSFLPAEFGGPPSGALDVVSGDFNEDGRVDFAALGLLPREVWVQLVSEHGTFEPVVSYGTGMGVPPTDVAAGNLDHDGMTDLAVSFASIDSVSVLMGQPGGGFQPASFYPLGTSPGSIAVGDLDGDGNEDLAVANYGTTNVSVLLGRGDGTFPAPTNYAVGLIPTAVAIADFNRDGRRDLAVANRGSPSNTQEDVGVRILLGAGLGHFASGVYYYAGVNAIHLATADFDGDGGPDLAVANYSNPGTVTVLLSRADGTFRDGISYETRGTACTFVTVGDFNGDQKPDLAVANEYSGTAPGSIAVLLGHGDGAFDAAKVRDTGAEPKALVTGDFDHDGKLDLAVAESREPGAPFSESSQVSVWPGNGDGTLGVPAGFAAGNSPATVMARDFNGDGALDLLVGSSGSIHLLLNRCVPSRVALQAIRSIDGLILSWPAGAAGFSLEATENLQTPSWDPVSTSPVLNGDRWEVMIPFHRQQRFFRLRGP